MSSKSVSVKYLGSLFFLLAVIILSLFSWCVVKKDHFAAISLHGDVTYYRNYGDWLIREVQDRDIFYNNIGKSIQNARQADIILLGHSMLMWALREELIKEFEKKYGVKIYNLGFAGVASGEFVKSIAKRWGLKPKLWIINADDQPVSFFNTALDDFGPFGRSAAIEVVKYNRFKSYFNVGGRNLRWHLEYLVFKLLPDKMSKALFPGQRHAVWRSIENGNWYLEQVSEYTKTDNPLIAVKRSQTCHTDRVEVAQARQYLYEMGGSSIFMLIPYTNFCPQRVRELAKILQVETVIPSRMAYTTADGGQHLDKKGAIAFTQFFLSELEKKKAFKEVVASLNSTRAKA